MVEKNITEKGKRNQNKKAYKEHTQGIHDNKKNIGNIFKKKAYEYPTNRIQLKANHNQINNQTSSTIMCILVQKNNNPIN